MNTLEDTRITSECPHCGRTIRYEPEIAGRLATCKGCSQGIILPRQSHLDRLAALAEEEETSPPGHPARVVAMIEKQRPGSPVNASHCDIATVYIALGAISIGLGIMLLATSVVAESIMMAAVGLGMLPTSVGLFAASSLLKDARTTADCAREILRQINSTV